MTALLVAALLSVAAPDPTARVIDRVAAIVNGDVITLRELQDRAGRDWRTVQELPEGPAREQARVKLLRATLDGLIAERLLEAEAKTLQLEVAEEEVAALVEDIRRSNRLDDASFARALAAEGITLEELRVRYRRTLLFQKVVRNKLADRLKVGDDDVRSYFQQHQREFLTGQEVHVRHVFLALPAGASATEETRVRALGESALARLRAGEDFAKVAREVSQGQTAREGGDLGWLKRGVVQPEVERVAFNLEPGKISDLVRTKPGFHILKVEARRGGEPRPFEEVKEEIRGRLMMEQAEGHQQQYVADLRKSAFLEIRMAELKE